MKKYLGLDPISVLNTATFKQSSLTFATTFLNGLLGMAFYVLVARFLGPSDFGLFSLSLVVLALVSDIGNVGINTGIVNFVSNYLKSDRSRSLQFLKLGLYLKIIISVITIIFGYFISAYLSSTIFSKPQIIFTLRLAFVGVAATWLFSFTTSYYQSTQKFISWGFIQIFANSVRLLIIFYMSLTGIINVNNAILSYILPLLIGFAVGFINIPIDFISEKINNTTRKEFYNYNKWVALFGGVSAFSSRVDTFILGRLSTPYGLGVYSAANQLVQVVPQLIGAIGTVIAPKLSSFGDDETMLSYFKKLQLMVVGVATGILFSTPIIKIIIDLLFGLDYHETFDIFVILLLAMLVFMVSIPVHNVIIYYYQFPKLFSYLSVLNLLVMLGVSYYLTHVYGYRGTAYAVLLTNTVNFIIPMYWFLNKIKFKKVVGKK